MKKKKLCLAVVLSLSALSGGVFAADPTPSSGLGWEQPRLLVAGSGEYMPPLLSSLLANAVKPGVLDSSAEVPSIRAEAIKEAAASLGARGGLAKKLDEIAGSLKTRVSEFDGVYNFSRVALRGNTVSEKVVVLPPVIVDGHDADSIPSEDEMRISDRIYKIHAKERLLPVDKKTGMPVMPNWRDYLLFSFSEVQMPHESMMPKTEGEKALWDRWVTAGWKEGEEQAVKMFDLGFARLNRDFHGMLKYKLAYSQGLVTRPKVSGVNMGTTGGGNEMRLNDRVIRITDHSALVPDESKWVDKTPE